MRHEVVEMTTSHNAPKKGCRVGDRVKSNHRAPWKGTVVGYEVAPKYGQLHKTHIILAIRQEIDRHDNPIRLQKTVRLDEYWVTPIPKEVPMPPVDKVFVPRDKYIFVFGSNRAGIHGAGAAADAHAKYGAVWGRGWGLMGNSFAIPTKDDRLKTLPLNQINASVFDFLRFAERRSDLTFFVTRIGCGLAGYRDEEISPLFKGATPNVELPLGWER